MNCRLVVVATLLLSSASTVVAQELDPDQEQVWTVVQSTWEDFKNENLDAFLGHYHPDWRRWGHRDAPIWGVEDLKQFAEEIWRMGNVETFELEPAGIVVDGDAALAHYRVREVYRIAGGVRYEFQFRWSDFLVRRDGEWRLIGGSRDDTCSADEMAANRCAVAASDPAPEGDR